MNLKDATALVTGGSSGIGFAIAKTLTEAGAKVAITDRDKQRLTATAKTIGAHPIHADVRQPAGPLSAGGDRPGGGRRGHPGLSAPPARAPATTAQHEPARTPEQGDQAPLERRRHLPESRRRDSARGGHPVGAGR